MEYRKKTSMVIHGYFYLNGFQVSKAEVVKMRIKLYRLNSFLEGGISMNEILPFIMRNQSEAELLLQQTSRS